MAQVKKTIVEATDIPAGTGALPRTITEVIQRDAKEFTSYTSVDGESYTFRTHFLKDGKRRAVPHRNELALFLCAREIGLGGSPFPVMDAFSLKIEDEDGKKVYPCETLETSLNDSFSLGD